MSGKEFVQAMVKFFSGLLLVGALLFLPAGTWDYWQAWLLIGILFVPMFLAGLVLMKKTRSCCESGSTRRRSRRSRKR